MFPRFFFAARAVFFLAIPVALIFSSTRADVPLPPNMLDPKNAPEAWNVIQLASANVEKLLGEKRLEEIPVQISLCSPAVRALAKLAPAQKQSEAQTQAARASGFINAVAKSATDKSEAGARIALEGFRDAMHALAQFFDAKTVAAEIFFCPMHPDFASENPAAPCAKCGMALVPRRIPYSFIYTAPGEPTMLLSATADAPLVAGREAHVRIFLKKRDGSPVTHADLMVMHTQPIHLLIVDPSLEDYHHEHPKPTGTRGEFVFSFTPKKNAPYRIWADLVPVATGVQEYAMADLPSAERGDVPAEESENFHVSAGGFSFSLKIEDRSGAPLSAKDTRRISVSIADADGKPVRNLAPVMNAFAHLVGFYDDYKTVVHIHPAGGDILRDDLRGGPTLGFLIYPPRAGFLRLYCQVLVEGKMIFAPFSVKVRE